MGGAYLAAAEQTLHTGAALCAAAQKSAKSLFPGLRNAASCALCAASGFLSKLCVGGEPLLFFFVASSCWPHWSSLASQLFLQCHVDASSSWLSGTFDYSLCCKQFYNNVTSLCIKLL